MAQSGNSGGRIQHLMTHGLHEKGLLSSGEDRVDVALTKLSAMKEKFIFSSA